MTGARLQFNRVQCLALPRLYERLCEEKADDPEDNDDEDEVDDEDDEADCSTTDQHRRRLGLGNY